MAAGLCLGLASPATTQMPEPQAARPPRPPVNLEFMQRIGLDILGDDIEMPEAVNQAAIGMEPDQTELHFQVYALSNKASFYKSLSDFPRQVSARIVGAGGRNPLRVRVRYTEEGEEPHWVLKILRRPRQGRTVSMVVAFRYGLPRATYQTRLIVTVPGRLPAPE